MAILGGLFLATVVFFINLYSAKNPDHEILKALPAALKQGAYTFLFGGLIMRTCENLAVRINPKTLAILAGIFVPLAITLTATFLVHTLRGTPDPLASTIPTALTAPWSFWWWATRKRRKYQESKVAQLEAQSKDNIL